MIDYKPACNRQYMLHGTSGLSAGTIAKRANTTDYSTDVQSIRLSEKKLLRAFTGIGEKNIIMLNQVHGDEIIHIGEPPREDRLIHADADGMLTALPGLCLVIRTADCVPVIAFDGHRRVLGAAHSGWKGCRLEIARKMIVMMRELHGSRPDDIGVFILPSIGPGSYAVNEDVAGFFPDHISRFNGRLHLDLPRSAASSVVRAGIPEKNIFLSSLCTLENSTDFFSHRHGDAGRNLNYAFIAPGLT